VTSEEEHQWRQHQHECANLRWHWDGAYQFGHDGTRYWARRADNGEVIGDPDLFTFREMIRLDYCHKPVTRAHDAPLRDI
jgi:hypothetical protein